jgi:sarcosine oxidase subunit delta
VYEFRFGGEYRIRPRQDDSDAAWVDYVFDRSNLNGLQQEWWYHRDGCGRWFMAERDTINNTVVTTYWPNEEKHG